MRKTTKARSNETAIPTKTDSALAEKALRVLIPYLESTGQPILELLRKGEQSKQISIPPLALRLLALILKEMTQGNTITLTPTQAELTTQEAANILNVSRPYLVQLLEKRKIPHHKVGTKRRIYLKDILYFKESIDKERLKVLEALTHEAQKLDMGY